MPFYVGHGQKIWMRMRDRCLRFAVGWLDGWMDGMIYHKREGLKIKTKRGGARKEKLGLSIQSSQCPNIQ
jgi:hypothetical protein